jgi:quinol-cytochrome oxidoreductase complex cytochrome b subunit
VRALALTAAALHLVLCAVAAFIMFFVATFPFENQSSERAAANDWLLGGALVIVILAIAIAGAVIASQAGMAAIAALAQFAAGAVVVAYALRESDHSDGRLVLYGLAFAITAVAAVTATQVQQR